MPTLTGPNYKVWRRLVATKLVAKDLWAAVTTSLDLPPTSTSTTDSENEGDGDTEDLVSPPPTATKSQRVNTILNAQALDVILPTLAASILLSLPEGATAKTVWDRLAAVHDRRDPAAVELLLHRYIGATWTGRTPLQDHLTHLSTMRGDLTHAGHRVSESEHRLRLLRSLPPAYTAIVTSIRTALSIQAMSTTQVESLLLSHEALHPASPVNPAAMAAMGGGAHGPPGGRLTCWRCGGPGHRWPECSGTPKPGWATNPANPDSPRYRGGQGPGGRAGDGGRGRGLSPGPRTAAANTPSTVTNYTLDSGASHHMVRDATGMQDFTAVEGVHVQVAEGGRTIPAAGRGHVDVIPTGHRESLRLYNTLHVPDLNGNLVSVSALVKTGHTITFRDDKAVITGGEGERGGPSPRWEVPLNSSGLYTLPATPCTVPCTHTALGATATSTAASPAAVAAGGGLPWAMSTGTESPGPTTQALTSHPSGSTHDPPVRNTRLLLARADGALAPGPGASGTTHAMGAMSAGAGATGSPTRAPAPHPTGTAPDGPPYSDHLHRLREPAAAATPMAQERFSAEMLRPITP